MIEILSRSHKLQYYEEKSECKIYSTISLSSNIHFAQLNSYVVDLTVETHLPSHFRKTNEIFRICTPQAVEL